MTFKAVSCVVVKRCGYENEGLYGEQTRHRSDCHLGDKNETLTMSVRINNSNTKKVIFLNDM